jgi:hypothetical protein
LIRATKATRRQPSLKACSLMDWIEREFVDLIHAYQMMSLVDGMKRDDDWQTVITKMGRQMEMVTNAKLASMHQFLPDFKGPSRQKGQ